MLAQVKRVGLDEARQVLNAVHAEGRSRTLYSNIYDLDDRVVDVYSFHNFDRAVVIDLAEELAKGPHTFELPSLFPRNFAREAFVSEQHEDMEKRREERGSVELSVETLDFKSPTPVWRRYHLISSRRA